MITLQETIGTIAVRQIQKRIRQGRITPKSNKKNAKGQKQKTLFDTGDLMRSIIYSVDGEKIIIGSNLPYAKIQHEGGIITPKNKNWLTIPLCPIAKVKRAPQFDDTFVKFYFDEGKNYGIIFQKADPDPIPLYKLVKKVSIPARPYMFLDGQDREAIAQAALTWIKKYTRFIAENRR